jgi:hypothetical protein
MLADADAGAGVSNAAVVAVQSVAAAEAEEADPNLANVRRMLASMGGGGGPAEPASPAHASAEEEAEEVPGVDPVLANARRLLAGLTGHGESLQNIQESAASIGNPLAVTKYQKRTSAAVPRAGRRKGRPSSTGAGAGRARRSQAGDYGLDGPTAGRQRRRTAGDVESVDGVPVQEFGLPMLQTLGQVAPGDPDGDNFVLRYDSNGNSATQQRGAGGGRRPRSGRRAAAENAVGPVAVRRRTPTPFLSVSGGEVLRSLRQVVVRPDGTATARWPNGAIAVSVDREGETGYRLYAAFRCAKLGDSLWVALCGGTNLSTGASW